MKIFLGILVFAAVGVILAAIKRDWLALGIYAIGFPCPMTAEQQPCPGRQFPETVTL